MYQWHLNAETLCIYRKKHRTAERRVKVKGIFIPDVKKPKTCRECPVDKTKRMCPFLNKPKFGTTIWGECPISEVVIPDNGKQ